MEAYVPGQGPLSKATLAERDRQLAGITGSGPAGWSGWPEEGSNPPPNLEADPAHPLFGQTVVFTGNLGMPRQQAKSRAAELGASPASNVTRKTTVLVVGDGFSAADLKSGRVTAKARRVLELHSRGQQIEVLSEGEFLQMVGGSWPETGA
jgi:DNA polymerase III subunit epsilon